MPAGESIRARLDAHPRSGPLSRWVPPRRLLLTSFAAAAAFALSFPLSATFVAGWPLVFLWPALLGYAAWSAPSWRALAVAAFPAFFMAFLAHQWWMREVTELGMPVLVAYLAAWMTLCALAVRALAGSRTAPAMPFAAVLPVALVSNEFLRGDLVCSGYAWFFASHPLVEWTTLAQIASIGGGWLLTAMAALVAGAALDALIGTGRSRLASPAAAAALLAAALVFGASHRGSVTRPDGAESRSARFLLVQTNLPMSNKMTWKPEAQVEDFISFARLTVDGVRSTKGGLAAAVWPETMVPGFGLERDSLKTLMDERLFPLDRFATGLRDLSTMVQTPLIVGSPAYLGLRVRNARFEWDRQFNSAYLVGPEGPLGRTDKIFLTPFGETMPVISNWDWLESQLLAIGAEGMTFDLEAAPAPHRFTLGTAEGPVRVGVPICFEITAPWASRRIAFDGSERAADVLVNISNDGWFAASEAGRRQHLQVAQLRAIELSTPVLRAANTGMSASINAAGELVAVLPPRTADTLVAEAALPKGVPLVARIGDGVAWTALVLLVGGFVVRRRQVGGHGSPRATA